MSRRKTKALLDRADRLHAASLPVVCFLYNNPEAERLHPGRLISERVAMIAGELYEASQDESVGAFHARLSAIARSRCVAGQALVLISVGDSTPQKQCRYNLDGTLKVPPPEDGPTLN
jgi:hypothetical protein